MRTTTAAVAVLKHENVMAAIGIELGSRSPRL
jgi:hypothetical protein